MHVLEILDMLRVHAQRNAQHKIIHMYPDSSKTRLAILHRRLNNFQPSLILWARGQLKGTITDDELELIIVDLVKEVADEYADKDIQMLTYEVVLDLLKQRLNELQK